MNVIILGNAVHNRCPGFAEVDGLEDVRSAVVHLVPLDGHVGCAGIGGRGFDHAHSSPFRHGFGRDVLPVASSVAGNVNQTVVAARPDHVLLRG